MLVDKIYQNLKNEIKIHKNSNILLAISGGVDSVFLLDVLSKIKNKYNFFFEINLIFINYNINTNSDAREDLCLKLSKHYRYPLVIKKSYLKLNNFESNARTERYQFLNDLLNDKRINYALTAHHKDDQIETLLMKYYDKSDWVSYLGIREKYNKIIRPIINISKEEIMSYAKENNLLWVDDPSNNDNSFRRNKIRNLMLPDIKRDNPDLINGLFLKHYESKRKFKIFLSKINFYKEKFIFQISSKFIIVSNDTKSLSDFVVFKLFYQSLLDTHFNASIIKTNGFWLSFLKFIKSSKTGSQFLLSNKISIIKDRSKHYIFNQSFLNKKNNIKLDNKFNTKSWYDTKITINDYNVHNNLELLGSMKIPCKKINEGIFIRNWEYGDKCYESKKSLKTIFMNNKISLFDKMKYPVITDSKNQIISVPNLYNYCSMKDDYRTIYWVKEKEVKNND